MSEARWELRVTPTVPETYEGMVLAGRAVLRGPQRALLIFQSLFIGFCAPIGATMLLWIIVALAGGPEFSELPAAAIPVTYVVFMMLAIWLTRQSYYMIAEVTVKSRFGATQQVILDQSGVTLITNHSRWHSGWADVALVRGGKKVLVLAISGIAISLPRSAFLGPQDADDALTTLQRWQEVAQ